MKKKFFSSKIKGFYVVSIVLGTMYALIGGLMLNEVCASLLSWRLWPARIWKLMPLFRLDDALQTYSNGVVHSYRMVVIVPLAILAVMLSVMLIEGRGGSAWRTKQLQAVCIMWVLLLINMALSYTKFSIVWEDFPGWIALCPVLVLIIPLLVLKRIRVLPKDGSSKWIPELSLK